MFMKVQHQNGTVNVWGRDFWDYIKRHGNNLGAEIVDAGGTDRLWNVFAQLFNLMNYGSIVGVSLQPDAQFAYSQPVGVSIAYDQDISVSGVGYDIGCGVRAVKTDIKIDTLDLNMVADLVYPELSFGIGRTNNEKVEHAVLESNLWGELPFIGEMRDRAVGQLGTIGSGNHFVDISRDDEGYAWIVAHFGSRGFGHGVASGYINLYNNRPFDKKIQGENPMSAPVLLNINSDLGQSYIASMVLAGRYAQAGREWVTGKVASILGAQVLDVVENHHNYAFLEEVQGQMCYVVRKGATPNQPGQRGVVGGSMGDITAIIQGQNTHNNVASMFSAVHGAGRRMSRAEAKGNRKGTKPGRISPQMMAEALRKFGTILRGGDLDEAPQAYRELGPVLEDMGNMITVEKVLQPRIVMMAPSGNVIDPYKD